MTSRNRYMAPNAPVVADSHEARRARMQRPISVWIVQLVLVAALAIVVVAIWQFGWVAALYGSSGASTSQIAFFLVTRIAVLGATGTAIVAIHRGRPAGRWIGLAAIAVLMVLDYLSTDRTQYTNDAERAGGTMARYIFIPLMLVWWAYAFGFSKKARHYFARQHDRP